MEEEIRSGAVPHRRFRIDVVLERTDLGRLLDELADPAEGGLRGRRWHCPLPAHDDRHPSVSMFTDRGGHQRWRCWSGDDTHRGDAIDLVIAVRRCSRVDAVEWLAGRIGIDSADPATRPRIRPRPQPADPAPPTDPDPTVTRYVATCERILWTVGGRQVRRWLASRGLIDDELLRANHVGADPGRQLLPRRRGLPPGPGVAAVFPALDQAGAVRYVQARTLDPGDGPKYLNPSAALAANPRLAWTVTVQSPRADLLVVCEGTPDALIAAQAGYQSVAVLGSHAPDRRVAGELVARARGDHRHLVAVVDNDDAGRTWGGRLEVLVGELRQLLTVVEPPISGADLNEWARQDSSWTATIRDATHTERQQLAVRRSHASPGDHGIDPF